MPSFIYRHPTEDDLPSITHIWNETSRGIAGSKILTVEEVRADTFTDEDYDPQGAWLVLADDRPVAFSDGFVDKKRLEYGRNDGALSVWVIPGWRSMGIEDELMDRTIEYLRGRGLATAQIWSADAHEWRLKTAWEKGFKEVRRFYMMRRDGAGPTEKPEYPEGITTRHVAMKGAGDEVYDTLVHVRNESFEDHYNFSPTTAARYKAFIEATNEVYSGILAMHEGRTVGLALIEDRLSSLKDQGVREGWIATLGVVKSQRRKGLGRALLLDSIGWLSSRDVTLMRLGVDAENERALGLYRSVGFDIEWGSVLAEKRLD